MTETKTLIPDQPGTMGRKLRGSDDGLRQMVKILSEVLVTERSQRRDALSSRLAVETVGIVPEEFLLRLRLEALPGKDVVDRIWKLAFRMR